MKYGVSNVPKSVCKVHQQAHPADESCPWCVPATLTATKPSNTDFSSSCDYGADPACYVCGGSGIEKWTDSTGTYAIACPHCVVFPGFP